MSWRKSTYSSNGGLQCVEVANAPGVANTPGMVGVRDTKQAGRADRTVVEFTHGAWAAFTASLK